MKPVYVESVEITDKIDCCPRDKGTINITVSSNQTGLDPACTRSMQYGNNLIYKFQCSPPARGKFVTVTLIGINVTLVFCHVVVRTIGKFYANVIGSIKLVNIIQLALLLCGSLSCYQSVFD